MCTLKLMFKDTGSSYNQKNGQYHSRHTVFRLFFSLTTRQFNLKGSKSESSAKEVWFRKIKSINLPKFKNDIRTSELLPNTPNHLVDLVNCFNTTLNGKKINLQPTKAQGRWSHYLAPLNLRKMLCKFRANYLGVAQIE